MSGGLLLPYFLNLSKFPDSMQTLAHSPTDSHQIFATEEDRPQHIHDSAAAVQLCQGGNVPCLSLKPGMWNTSNSSDQHGNTTNVVYESIYNWEVLVLLPIMVFGIAGNILVCMAISMEKRLQSVTNYFLLSLAVTDLLLCIVVMPFSIIHEFLGYWPFDFILCDMFVTCDVLMCTASILHLCTISLERYLAIRSPLALRNKSKSIVILKIIAVWVIALAISSPITILGLLDHKNVLNNKQCALTNVDFILYGSTAAFFIPLGIMVTAYALTIKLLQVQSKGCNDNEGLPMIRRSMSRRANKFRKHVKFKPRRTKSCPASGSKRYGTSPFTENGRSRYSVKSCIEEHLQEPSETPPPSPLRYQNAGAEDLHTIQEENHNGINWRDHDTMSTGSDLEQSPKRLKNLVKKHQLVLKAANILLLKKEGMQHHHRHNKDDVRTERKASKTLGVVFAIFVICWAPFFIVNIMTVLCLQCEFQPLLITSFVWLGYVSSTLNPIIYTTFNKTFKMTFIKLLKCQYGSMQKSLRVRWNSKNGYQSTYKTTSSYTPNECNESML